MTKKCTIISQIITLLHVETFSHCLMHGVTMKFIEARQAKLCNTYK